MNPADRRITELIDKWLASIELHLKYVELSDAAYARTQSWPKHDRPTRWVLEVAKQKALELKMQCENRHAMGDSKFSESLELMAFLANLIGIQHIQRFIPLADAGGDARISPTHIPTVEAPGLKPTPKPRAFDDTTREMPRLRPAPAVASAPAPATRGAGHKPPVRPLAASAARPSPPVAAADVKDKVIADAIRLLKWGKQWHELAELIDRIAERPPLGEIRKILRGHKSEIEARAAQSG